MDQRSGGGRCLRVPVEAESIETGYAEMLFEQARGVTCLENPIVEARFHAAEAVHFIRGGNGEQRDRLGEQDFARAQDAEFVAQTRVCLFACKFGGAKFAGGEVDVGEANRVFRAAGRGFSGRCSDRRSGAVPAADAALAPAARLRETAARKLFSLDSTSELAVAVPGVSTRITSRRTIFFPGPGSSICSQMATLWPARISRAM